VSTVTGLPDGSVDILLNEGAVDDGLAVAIMAIYGASESLTKTESMDDVEELPTLVYLFSIFKVLRCLFL
jgi:hypothetical protein